MLTVKTNVEELKKNTPSTNMLLRDCRYIWVIMEAASNNGYDTENPYTHHGYVHVPRAKDPQLDICPQYVFNDLVHPTRKSIIVLPQC